MYNKILIATDGTAHSVSAILEAGEMARRHQSAICLLHVLGRIVAIDPLGGSSVVISQQLQESTRKFMDTFRDLTSSDGVVRFETVVRQGEFFYHTILEEALARQSDLIMLGRRQSSLMKRLLFQSLTSQLLRQAPCPVLIVPVAAMISWQCILLATHDSPAGAAAAAEAFKIARAYGSRLLAAACPPGRDQARTQDHVRALQAAAAQAGVAVEIVALPAGDAAAAIASVAKSRAADMIITGQPGEGILAHILRGGFPERIVDRSLCSVLVVPGPQARNGAPT